jgi:hypothetical protein
MEMRLSSARGEGKLRGRASPCDAENRLKDSVNDEELSSRVIEAGSI